MGSVGRRFLQRHFHHGFHLPVGDDARSAWPRSVLLQSGDPALKKTAPPARRLLLRHPHPLGDLLVLQTIGGQKHDPRPLYQPGRLGSLSGQTLQRGSLFETQFNHGCRTHRVVLYSMDAPDR